jgi:alkylated DNA repair protein alkB family protein 8
MANGGRGGGPGTGDQSQSSNGGSCGSAGDEEGPDYLVPWHLPFHRAGALGIATSAPATSTAAPAAAAGTSGSGGGPATGSNGCAGAAGDGGCPAPAAAARGVPEGTRLDAAKGAVVFQRYYHLFGPGEVEGLVGRVAGVGVTDVFYDKGNWCVVFERRQG